MDSRDNAKNEGNRGDAFGASGIGYENFGAGGASAQPEGSGSGIPINVINAVNANGIVSGRKVVDHAWKQAAVCAFIVALGLLAGLVVAIMMANDLNGKIARLESDKTVSNNNLTTIYGLLGADSQQGAIDLLNNTEVLNGGDLAEIRNLLTGKYGVNYELDLGDANINFVQTTGAFKYVSLGVVRPSGTVRAVMYERISDGKWIMSSFDSTRGAEACADVGEEERKILRVLSVCNETEEAEAQAAEQAEGAGA